MLLITSSATFRGHPAAAPLTRAPTGQLWKGAATFRGQPAAAPLTQCRLMPRRRRPLLRQPVEALAADSAQPALNCKLTGSPRHPCWRMSLELLAPTRQGLSTTSRGYAGRRRRPFGNFTPLCTFWPQYLRFVPILPLFWPLRCKNATGRAGQTAYISPIWPAQQWRKAEYS